MSRDSTQLLSMALVLNNDTLEPSAEILYADYINSESVVSAFNSLVDLGSAGGACQSAEELITANDSLMSKTNSNQFYNGDAAKHQFENMEMIRFKFEQLRTYVNGTEELSLIENGIKNYNDKLTKLKCDCRKKLLQNKAEEFNAQKNEWEGFPKTKTYRWNDYDYNAVCNPETDPEFGYCYGSNKEVYETEMISSNTTKHEQKDDTGCVYSVTYSYTATYKIHKYKFIKYWNFFKAWESLFDPGYKEIEVLFNEVGADLPYDPALIVGPDAD